MRRRLLLAALVALGTTTAQAQRPPEAARADTLRRDTLRSYEAGPVVVTGTREPRRLADVPVPTAVVTREQIAAQGSLRLSDLLAEQPGLVLMAGIAGGQGVQLQGFSPEYTLVLVDGEPVIGRAAGVLDLDRLAVGGVERVEVVRGPTSSRYGSDALAGVVNLVTPAPREGLRGTAGLRAESFGTLGLSASAEGGRARARGRVFVDRLASAGYDLDPATPGATSPAYVDHTAEVRLRLDPAARTRLGLAARVQDRRQRLDVAAPGGTTDQTADRLDGSITPSLRQRFGRSWVLDASLHAARYRDRTDLVAVLPGDDPAGAAGETSFAHRYAKAEASLGYVRSAAYAAYAGGGWASERVGGERYTAPRRSALGFAFAEMQWMPSARWDVNASVRADAPSDYAAVVSPRLAVLYKPRERVRVRASLGRGYRAPAFRQRYLAFTNVAGGGYSVFGAEVVQAELARLAAAGHLGAALVDPAALVALRPETSTALLVGLDVPLGRAASLRVDGFRHRVRDLIETEAVATETSGATVFSYRNVARSASDGVELEATWRPSGALLASASVQALRTVDRDVLDAVRAGRVYWRDADAVDRQVRVRDYLGLVQRSPLSGTVRVEHRLALLGLTTSLRLAWRSPFGVRDLDGNGVFVGPGERAPAMAFVSGTVSRPFGRATAQAGVRNLLDRTDALALPGQPGRAWFGGVTVSF